MRFFGTRLVLLLLTSGVVAGLQAQAQDLRFVHLSQEDGLSAATSIYTFLQDQHGFLWMGTWDGLNRYDGYGFTVYHMIPGDTTSLSHDTAIALLETRDGMLWVGTEGGGLNQMDPATEQFTRYLHDPNDAGTLSSHVVTALAEDLEGRLWVGTQHGLNRMDRMTGRFMRFLNDPDAPPTGRDAINAVHVDTEGGLWAATFDGVTRLNPTTGAIERLLAADNPLPPSRTLGGSEELHIAVPNKIDHVFTALLERPEAPGVLWLVGRGLTSLDTRSGLHEQYLPDETTAPGTVSDIEANLMVDLVQDPVRSGRLWIATSRGGLLHFDIEEGTFKRYQSDLNDQTSLSVDELMCLQVDQAGLIWVGTETKGLNRFDPAGGAFTHYRSVPGEPNSLPYPGMRGMAEDRTGALWVASTSGGLTRIDRITSTFKHWRSDPDDRKALQGNAFPLLIDRAGTLWVGTVGASQGSGLFRLNADGKTFTPYHSGSQVWSLYEDQSGAFWVGTMGGLDRFDRETGTFDPFLAELERDMIVMGLYEDRSGQFWVGTWGKGLARLDRDTGEAAWYTHDPSDSNSLNSLQVNAIHERAQEPGVLWIATHGGGLDRFDTRTGAFRHYTTKDGLPHNVVYGLLEDENGHLWMSTNQGLARFDPEAETAGSGLGQAFKHYGMEHGVQSLEFNRLSYYKSPRTGEMFFGGINGLNAFHPARLTDNTVPPPVALTDFRLYNQPVVPGKEAPIQIPIHLADQITLQPDQDVLTLEFAALHFKHPEKNQYRYRLEGFSDEWLDAGTQRTATYTNLPPGDYVFRVKASNSDGVWSEEGASIRLLVLPPWWRTWWAYALYGLLVTAGIVALDRVQRQRLLRRERERTMQRDLEQTRRIEAMNVQLRDQQQQLEDRNRKLLELDDLKSRFFANISHEFRTPLTLILGPLNDALAGNHDPERLLRQAPFMHRSARRLLRLVNQLLDLSRLEAGGLHLNLQSTDLDGFVRRLVLAFSSRANREGLTLLYDGLQEGQFVGAVDCDKLEKVVTNLLSNAIKFTPRGGKVRVALRAGPSAPESREAAPDGWAELVVEDTGRGIPPEALPKIFDRFYQVDSSMTRTHEGSGIGLALTRELVNLHGGTITVESKEGFGTSFTVHLPLISFCSEKEIVGELVDMVEEESIDDTLIGNDEEVSAERAQLILDPLLDSDMPTVLIVEDNIDMRAYLGSLLRDEGYRIEEACDGQDGFDRASALLPDLIISDIMMPNLDGFALCRAIKASERLSHLPVVLLTAKAAEEDRLEGLEAGADDYLYKPFSAEELLLRTENLIEIRRRMRMRFSDQVRLGPSEIVLPSAEAAFVEQVRTVVEAELSNGAFTMDQLAEAVGLSRRQLHRRLKAAVGLTPAGYVRMMRLERAAQLLKQKAGTVAEVSYAVGFNDADYFSRLFKQTHGVPPSQYRTDWTS